MTRSVFKDQYYITGVCSFDLYFLLEAALGRTREF